MDDATLTLREVVAVPERETAAEQRLRTLLEEHYDFVWRVLRRLGVREGDVDDAAQKCFLIVAARLESIGPAKERAFLFQTALRVASNEKRTQRRRREAGEAPLAELADSSVEPEESLDRLRARELLDKVLDTMPEELRAAFVLFELEGFSTQEVAQLQGWRKGTAASRIRRAREHYEVQIARLQIRLSRGGKP